MMRNGLSVKFWLCLAVITLVLSLGQPCLAQYGMMPGGMMGGGMMGGGMMGGMMGPAWGRGAWMGPGYWGNGMGGYGGYGGYGYPGYGPEMAPPTDGEAKFNEETRELQEKIQAASQKIDEQLRLPKPDKDKILADHKELMGLQAQLQEKALKFQLENRPAEMSGQQAPYGGYGWGGAPGWGGPWGGWRMGGGPGWMRWGGPWGMGGGYPSPTMDYPGYGFGGQGFGGQGFGSGYPGYGYQHGMGGPTAPAPMEEKSTK